MAEEPTSARKRGSLTLLKRIMAGNAAGQGESGSTGEKSSSTAIKSKWGDITRRKTSIMVIDRLRKKRDGTPEKSLTPSQEPDESLTPTKNVIWNEDIQRLQIKHEDLPKAWPPRPPSGEKSPSPAPVKVSVKKVKKVTDEDKPKSRLVSVAKPAPPDVPIQPRDYSGYSGPRYDSSGRVIMHSLLGTYEDFHREAGRRGNLTGDIPAPEASSNMDQVPSVKYEKKKRSRTCNVRLSHDENNALRNWQLRMLERKRQQGYISNLLQKAPEDLAMNQADNFRSIQEKRYMIDRAIPKVDYGKGYRVGSEFWHQQEQFGDDLTGVHMSLTQAQRGYPAPVEQIGLSKIVKEEKGSEWIGRQTPHLNYPWHKSDFLRSRQEQLQPFMDELSAFKPDYDHLQVLGSNVPFFRTVMDEKKDPTKSDDEEEDDQEYGEETDLGLDVKEEEVDESKFMENNLDVGDQEKPIFGPSLLFGDQRACWLGDSFSRKDEVGIEARVTFECMTGDRITSYLQLGNNGTTSIYYDWKKMSKENPFDLVQAQSQRFYFNNSSGVILPGETLNFPFVFKSSNAGVFTEQWKLETRPVVCSGAALLVTLRGVAIQEDKFKKQREELEKELVQKQAKQVVNHLLYELISGVRTPERSRSPVDAYITEEEIFQRNNPGLVFSHETVAQLKDLHAQLYSEEDLVVNIWSLSIQDLQDAILDLDEEEDEKKENLLHQMNELVGKLSYIPHMPLQQRLQAAGHQLFVEAIDRIVGQSMLLRNQMGLPDREQDDVDGGDSLRLKSSDSRKGGRVPDKGKQDTGKDKGKPGAKDAKVPKGKEAKVDSKGKTTPGPNKKATTPSAKPSPAPTPASQNALATAPLGGGEKEVGAESSSSHPSSPEPGLGMSDVDLASSEKLYKETLASQVYEILGDMADGMDQIFSALIESRKVV